MSTIKKGMTVASGDWAHHLRKVGRRFFWKKQRQDFKRDIRDRIKEK